MLFASTFLNLSSAAEEDCDAFYGSSIPDDKIDGTIGPEWDDAGTFTNVPISPFGIATLRAKQDGTFVYIALKFVADSENPWVCFQLGPSFCMSSAADGALFGDDALSANGYVDIYFTESAGVARDSIQDGKGAIIVNASKFVFVELKKPLNSGDAEGKDIGWGNDSNGNIQIFWDSDGGGSSGGIANHAAGTQSQRTMRINSQPVPEFTNLTLVLCMAVIVIPAIMLKKRQQKRARRS
jgi:hypothetical protein